MSVRFIRVPATKPYSQEISVIGRACHVSRAEAFLAWFAFVSWLDERTEDGVFPAGRKEVDAAARLTGFAAALESSGVLLFDGEFAYYRDIAELGRTSKRRCRIAREHALKAVKATRKVKFGRTPKTARARLNAGK